MSATMSHHRSTALAPGLQEHANVPSRLPKKDVRLAVGGGLAFAALWLMLYAVVLVGGAGRWVPVAAALVAIAACYYRGVISIWIASAGVGCAASFLSGPLPSHLLWLLILRNILLALSLPTAWYWLPRALTWARNKNWLQFSLAAFLVSFVFVGLGSLYWRNNLRPRHAKEELIQLAISFGAKVRSSDKKVPLAGGLFADSKVLADRDLDFAKTRLTDMQLQRLARHTGADAVRSMHLQNNGITDHGARELARLTNLNYLKLNECLITDEGVKELCNLRNLEGLTVYSPYFTDRCFSHLRDLPGLRQLDISGGTVTEGAIRRFREDRPLCTVNNMTYKQQLQSEVRQ